MTIPPALYLNGGTEPGIDDGGILNVWVNSYNNGGEFNFNKSDNSIGLRVNTLNNSIPIFSAYGSPKKIARFGAKWRNEYGHIINRYSKGSR